jgi:hypothetical protein
MSAEILSLQQQVSLLMRRLETYQASVRTTEIEIGVLTGNGRNSHVRLSSLLRGDSRRMLHPVPANGSNRSQHERMRSADTVRTSPELLPRDTKEGGYRGSRQGTSNFESANM